VQQTVGTMAVGSIVSLHGNVTLTSAGAIIDSTGDAATDVFGNNISMTALGSIGTFANDLDIDSGFSGPGVMTALSIRGDVALHETSGDLLVASAFAAGAVDLTSAGSILDANSGASEGANIHGVSSILIAAGAIGTAKDSLDTDVLRLEALAQGGGIWIDNIRPLEIGGLSNVVGLTALGGPIHLVNHGGHLHVEESVNSIVDVTLQTTDSTFSDEGIAIIDGADIVAQDGSVTLLAGDNFLLDEGSSVSAAGSV
jgi:hypothetical protein